MIDNLNKMNFSQKTAFVYGGAAFLILVVGARSILLTSDDFGALSYFTIGAILLETILLFVYAKAIYNQSGDKQEESLSVDLDMSTLENKISELNTKINQLNVSIGTMDNFDSELTLDTMEFETISNNLAKSIDNLESKVSGFKENADDLAEKLSDVLVGIVVNNDKIDKVLNRQINEEIKSEIRILLEKTLTK